MVRNICTALLAVALMDYSNVLYLNAADNPPVPSLPRGGEPLVLRILNGQLNGCTAQEAVKVMGSTNWLAHAEFAPRGLRGDRMRGIHDSCAIGLPLELEKGCRVGVEFSQDLPFFDATRIARDFFSGRGTTTDLGLPMRVRQYYIAIANWIVVHYATGETSVWFCTEYGSVMVAHQQSRNK